MTAAPAGARPARVFDRAGAWRMTELDARLAATMLTDEALTHWPDLSAVIGIANGGLEPAHYVAARADLPAYQVSARHNANGQLYLPASGHVTYHLADLGLALAGRKLTDTVLLVDDICGSGATFATLRRAITRHLTPDARLVTAALCRNAGAEPGPDLWIWRVTDWVIFPWEDQHADAPTRPLPIPTRVGRQ